MDFLHLVDLYGKCIGAPHIDLKAVCVFPENSVQLMDSAGEPLIASHFSKIEGADGGFAGLSFHGQANSHGWPQH